jgi:hypothetical protein
METAEGRYEEATSPAVDGAFDPGHYQTWIEDHLAAIYTASKAFDVPASVIAGVLAVEHEYDRRSDPKTLGEWGLSRLCGAPFIGRAGVCDTASFGAGQVQIRRAELVDTAVREAVAEHLCTAAECADVIRSVWATGRGALIGRLRDEGTNILYVAAYMDLLRDTATPGTSWRVIYQEVTDPAVGSYNAYQRFGAGFVAASSYYSYLDRP